MPGFRGVRKSEIREHELVIGGNGCGKTTLLKGIALATLGPAVADSGLFPYHLVRRADGEPVRDRGACRGDVHAQRAGRSSSLDIAGESRIRVDHRGDLERFRWEHRDEKPWHPIFSNDTDAFFFVRYGANRRVEKVERVDEAGRRASSFTRAQRIMSLFEETYSLRPLSHWLPRYQERNPGRFSQVKTLVNNLLGPGRYSFTGDMEDGEYVFEYKRIRVPFPALSDGYRAFSCACSVPTGIRQTGSPTWPGDFYKSVSP